CSTPWDPSQRCPSPPQPGSLSWITSSPYIRDAEAANSFPLFFTHRISTVVNVSPEVVNTGASATSTPWQLRSTAWGHAGSDAAALCCWGEWVPTTCLACPMKHRSMSLGGAHTSVEPCHPIIQPNSSLWQQVIGYDSPSGMILNVYENEVRSLPLKVWGICNTTSK
uniref:Uncharacterized protein n=1 Tax=Falco tinnunculus TaxID=100819 RepID=A0A8C4UAV8_FALTI